MKVEIEKGKLHNALGSVRDMIGGGEALPILNNCLVKTCADGKAIEITGTNLDMVIRIKVPCEVKEPGETTVNAKLFGAFVGSFAVPTITFTGSGLSTDRATVEGGDTHFTLAQREVTEFPESAKVEGEHLELLQKTFKDALRKTAFAMSSDDTRRVLKGLLLECDGQFINFVATDGRRLARVQCDADGCDKFQIVMPDSLVRQLSKLLQTDGDVTMTVGKGVVLFETEGWSIQSKLVDGAYPNYKQVIPRDLAEAVSVDRGMFVAALRQVSLSADGTSPTVKIAVKDNTVEIKADNADVSGARSSFAVKYDGKGLELLANPKYILDVLTAADDDEVTLSFTDGRQPFTFEEKGADFLAVVMPLRVN